MNNVKKPKEYVSPHKMKNDEFKRYMREKYATKSDQELEEQLKEYKQRIIDMVGVNDARRLSYEFGSLNNAWQEKLRRDPDFEFSI